MVVDLAELIKTTKVLGTGETACRSPVKTRVLIEKLQNFSFSEPSGCAKP
jgi:hypothetical protein